MVARDNNKGCGHCGCGDTKNPKNKAQEHSKMNQFNENEDEVDHDIKTGFLKSSSFAAPKNAGDEEEGDDEDDEDFDDDDDFDEDEEDDDDEDFDDDTEEPSEDEEIEENRFKKPSAPAPVKKPPQKW